MATPARSGRPEGAGDRPPERRAGSLRGLLTGLDAVLTGVLMLALVVVVSLQVLFRYLFYQPMGWTEEAGRYLFIWLTLLGAAVGVRRKAHFGFDLLANRLSPPYTRALGLASSLLGAVFCATFTWFGGYLVAATTEQTSPGLDLPMAVPYLALPLCGGLMTAYFLSHVVRGLRADRR
jgi:TRAP-type C4-dicarboxylate transport system permease small subunit